MSFDSSFNNKPFQKLTQDDVISTVIKALVSDVKRTTTYKFGFFKCILDNLFNVNIDTNCFLSYDSIALRFSEIYWNLILKFNLNQLRKNGESKNNEENKSAIERIFSNFVQEQQFYFKNPEEVFPFESLTDTFKLKISQQVKKQVILKNVIGAFCKDTNYDFFQFDKKENGIYLNPDVYEVLIRFKSSFEKLNYYEWIKFLETINKEEDSYALANKLDASTERKNLSSYRNILLDFGQKTCFYCNRQLLDQTQNPPVDHFIPWSFIKDDKLWNFVLACPRCNSQKSNIFPHNDFISTLRERNLKLVNFDSQIVKEDFKTYSSITIDRIFHAAAYNGYQLNWQPK